MQKLILFLVAFTLFGCDNSGDIEKDISKIPIEASVLKLDTLSIIPSSIQLFDDLSRNKRI